MFVWAISITLFLGNVGPPMPRCVILWPSLRIGTVRLGLADWLYEAISPTRYCIFHTLIHNEQIDPKFLRIQRWGVRIVRCRGKSRHVPGSAVGRPYTLSMVIQREYLVEIRDSLYLAHHGNNQCNHQHSNHPSLSRQEIVLRLIDHSTSNRNLPEPPLTRPWVEGGLRAVQNFIVAFAPQSAVATVYLLFETWWAFAESGMMSTRAPSNGTRTYHRRYTPTSDP